VSELDDGDLHLVVNVGETVSLVVDDELEYTESPWGLEFVRESCGGSIGLVEGNLVVWVKHGELELDVICDKRNPFTVLLFVNVYEVFNVNHSFVVLGVWLTAVPLFSLLHMSDVGCSQNASFLKVPLNHLCAEDVVAGALKGHIFGWVSVGEHGFVAAHF